MFLLRKIYYLLPPNFRFIVRWVLYMPEDMLDSLFTRSTALKPPKRLIFTGGGEFLEQGRKMKNLFVELGGLRPNAKVLDVGSGIGRVALALVDYLSIDGSYEGFDAIKLGVGWCQKNISTKYKNFNFQYIPLKNDLYRKAGINPISFEFPYPTAAFDFVCVISVFTHLIPEELENYLRQISRVLKPGGICFATFFVFTDEKENPGNLESKFQFPFNYGHYKLMDNKVKHANVAYNRQYLETIFKLNHLNVIHEFEGSWNQTDQTKGKDFQDILVLKKSLDPAVFL